MAEKIRAILEDLTGQKAPFDRDYESQVSKLLAGSGLGYTQLNEILLLLGYDRIRPAFFQFLIDGTPHYENGNAFHSLEDLRIGVDRFRVNALLLFGNIKYAFKSLSGFEISEQDFIDHLSIFEEIDESVFAERHDPVVPISSITGDQTYYLGYLIERELKERLKRNPQDSIAKEEWETRKQVVEIGKKNHEAYLASDHLDIYVATSMREKHEYQMISQVVDEVFSCPRLKNMKVRWFDPTQAYCSDRIDKGLAEGLMLKRALCTLYLAQESDTLGKDSELASTLAQGKPVIAFIPSVTPSDQDDYVEKLLQMVKQGHPGLTEPSLILQQLQVFSPQSAWRDPIVMSWVADPSKMDLKEAKQKLGTCIRDHYDKRANTLKESHPLGIQVHLETGVANGVIVARSIFECRELIRRVLTNTLEFSISHELIEEQRYLLLKEKITQSVFRVVSGDRFLTNAFWNFYLPK